MRIQLLLIGVDDKKIPHKAYVESLIISALTLVQD